MSLRTTGTANWTSHCGGNFSFIDTFIREKANLGYLRRGTEQRLNSEVLDAYHYIQDVSANESAELLQSQQDAIKSANQAVLDRENINPNDGIPAYVSNQLIPDISELDMADCMMIEDQRRSYLSEFYDAVRKDGFDSYLSEDVKAELNSDSFSFDIYDKAMMEQEAYEMQKADDAKKKSMLKPNRDYSKGFEEDEHGNLIDDGYGFDDDL